MPEIIGLVGVMGSGKTFTRDSLIKDGFVPVDLKDGLIEMTNDLVGFSIIEDYDLFKETIVGFTHPSNKIQPEIKKLVTRRVLEQFPDAMTGRKMLQRLGTEVMRKHDEDFWVNVWSKKAKEVLSSKKSVVVADVRFPNEVEALKSLAKDLNVCCTIIFCNYKSDRYIPDSPHPSERLAQDLLASGATDGQAVFENQP